MGHVAGIGPWHWTHPAHRIVASVIHAAHSHAASGGVSPVRDELLENVVGSSAGAVDPVVQHHDPLMVVTSWFAWVVDHHRCIESAVELDAGMRVEEVCTWVGCGEFVDEVRPWPDRVLGHSRHPVCRVSQPDAVPVNRRVSREPVVQGEPKGVASGGTHERARH